MEAELTRGQIADASSALAFVLAGNATFTVVSKKTEARFTFKCKRADEDDSRPMRPWFVSLLRGPDNESDYTYLGLVRESWNGLRYEHGRKSKVSPDAPSARAASWLIGNVLRGQLPESCELWHDGRCGRCGRALTVPESVASGFGPECIKRI